MRIEEYLKMRPEFVDHTAIVTGLFFLILAIGVSFSCSILEMRSNKYSFVQILVFFYLRILLSTFTLISNLNLFTILIPAILSPVIWMELIETFTMYVIKSKMGKDGKPKSVVRENRKIADEDKINFSNEKIHREERKEID